MRLFTPPSRGRSATRGRTPVSRSRSAASLQAPASGSRFLQGAPHGPRAGGQHDQPQADGSPLLVKLGRTLGVVSWTIEVQSVKADPYRDTRGPGRAGFRDMLDSLAKRKDPKSM